jgi:3-oxoacyl-[acyl-carrier protein] reductase
VGGTPADIADTVHWLASPGAGHVTGQIVQVNGGARKGN